MAAAFAGLLAVVVRRPALAWAGKARRSTACCAAAGGGAAGSVRERFAASIDGKLKDLAGKIAGAQGFKLEDINREAAELQRKLQAELEEEHSITAELTKRIDTLQKAYSQVSDSLEFQQAEATEQIDSIQKTLRSATQQLDAAKTAESELLNRLNKAEQDEATLQEELLRIEQKLRDAEAKEQSFKQKQKDMLGQVEAKEGQVVQLTGQLSNAQVVATELRKSRAYFENQNKELFQRLGALQSKEIEAAEFADLLRKAENKLKMSAKKEQEMLDSLASKAQEAANMKGQQANAELREAELRRVRRYFEEQNKALIEQVMGLQEKEVRAEEIKDLLRVAEAKAARSSKKEQDLLQMLASKASETSGLVAKLGNAELREGELRKAKAYFEAQNKELLQRLGFLQEKENQAAELTNVVKLMGDKLQLSAKKEQAMLNSLAARVEEAANMKGEMGKAELREGELRRVKKYFEEQNKELIERVTDLQGKEVEAGELANLLDLAEAKVRRASQKEQALLDYVAAKDKDMERMKAELQNASLRETEYKRARTFYEVQNKALVSSLAEAHENNLGLENELVSAEQKLEALLAKFV